MVLKMTACNFTPINELTDEVHIAEQLLKALDQLDQLLEAMEDGSLQQRRVLTKNMALIEYIEALQVRWLEVCCE